MDQFLFLYLILFSIFLTIKSLSDLEINTPFGTLKGDDRDWYIAFEGVPYGEPPTGDRRFEPPMPFKSNVRISINDSLSMD